MRCSNCHKTLNNGVKFCTYCGQPVTPTVKPETGKSPKTDANRRMKRMIKILLVTLIAVVVLSGAFVALLYTGVLDFGRAGRTVTTESSVRSGIGEEAGDAADSSTGAEADEQMHLVPGDAQVFEAVGDMRHLSAVRVQFYNITLETTYTYDFQGRLAEEINNNGHFYCEYDEQGRLLRKSDPSDPNGENNLLDLIEREYNDDGQLVGENRYCAEEGWREATYTYGADGQMATETVHTDTGTYRYNYSHSTDADGNRVALRTNSDSGEAAGEYIYFSDGRILQGYSETWDAPVEYAYNHIYNYLTGSFAVYTVCHPMGDGEYTAVYLCIYDAAGAVVEELCLCSSETRDMASFVYDDDGYLVAVEIGDERAELVYSDAAERIYSDEAEPADNGEALYAEFLNLFYDCIESDWQDTDALLRYCDDGISYLYMTFGYTDEIGYAVMDINNDGTPELLIGVDDEYYRGSICDLYTYADGELVYLFSSGERWGHNLCEDGTVTSWGSSGAASFSAEHLYLPSGGREMCMQEGYFSEPDESWTNTYWYYAPSEYYESYDRSLLTPITAETADAISAQWPATVEWDMTMFSDYTPR